MKNFTATALLISLALCAAGRLRAFTVETGDDDSFLFWPPERTAVFYRIGADGTAVPPESVEGMERAFVEWEDKSRGEITFICEGLLDEGRAVRDGHNTMVWTSRVWPYGSEIAAVSTLWPGTEPGRIEEVDIEFNARDYDWTLPGSPELLETALHEIGHLLGIGHSFNPGAVMHDRSYPDAAPRRALSRDDLEALAFLYPRREWKLFPYDLPVLFYPRAFPGEVPVSSPVSGFDPGPGRWITALGSIDISRNGFLSEVLTAVRDEEQRWSLSVWSPAPDGEDGFRQLGPAREFPPPGEIRALAGVDYDRDGRSDEAAVLVRSGGGEEIFICRFDPAGPGPKSVLSLVAPPAGNLIGMAALDPGSSGLRDGLLLLRSYPGRHSLFLHRLPLPGEAASAPDPGIEIPLPGLQAGSRILGLAVLDAEGFGRERDLVFIELDEAGDYWLHLFTLSGPAEGEGYDIVYRNSSRLPAPPLAVHPGRVTGLDLTGDGFYNHLIFYAPGK